MGAIAKLKTNNILTATSVLSIDLLTTNILAAVIVHFSSHILIVFAFLLAKSVI